MDWGLIKERVRPLLQAMGMSKATIADVFIITAEPTPSGHDREFIVTWQEYAKDSAGHSVVLADGSGLAKVTKRAAVVVDFIPF
jgi:hypothetical protein